MKHSKIIIIQIIILSLLIFSIYTPTLIGIYKKVSTNKDYTHALLMPFIAGYLIWERRKDLLNIQIKPCLKIFPLILFTFLFSLYGVLGSDISAARISWWLWLVCIVIFCYGIDAFKTLFLPLIMLGFMIPLPQHVQAPLTMSLKLISSKLAFFIINTAGIPVHVEGNIIDLGDVQLQVVDACSGLRYVLPLIALGILCAYFFQKHLWKRIILVILTLPIAVLMNGLRVGITAILYQWVSPKVAEGFFHGFSGWFIFIASFALLMGFNYILKLLPPKDFKKQKDIVKDLKQKQNNYIVFGIIVVLLSVLFLTSISTATMPRVKLINGIKAFPLEFNGWKGILEPIDPEILKRSGAEEGFQATYINKKKEIVSVYIGYRGTPFMETEEFFHSPTVCLPASGWKILEKTTYRIPNIPYYKNFVVTRLLAEKMGQRQLLYFWFQTKSKIARHIFENRFHLALHALKRDNTYDLTVHVYTPIKYNEDIKIAQKRLNNFVKDLESVMIEFLNKKGQLN